LLVDPGDERLAEGLQLLTGLEAISVEEHLATNDKGSPVLADGDIAIGDEALKQAILD
jgi:hypothetical protein